MNSALRRPVTLVVDDEPESQLLLRDALRERGACEVLEPWRVEQMDLEAADLVLVDLTLESGPELEESVPLAQRPADGLALAAVLRSHLPQSKPPHLRTGSERPPTAFALHTSHLDYLVPDLPPDIGEHVAARLNNLEWAFRKQEAKFSFKENSVAPPLVPRRLLTAGPSRVERIEALASAAAALPERWAHGSFEDTSAMLRGLLGLGDDTWHLGAEEHARRCHPPLFEVAADSHGLAFIRWLLHRIFPYPSFLIDSHYLALKLQLDHNVFVELVTARPGVAALLDVARYSGVLDDFTGPRWWRSGVDAVIFQLTEGDIFNRARLQRELDAVAQDSLTYQSESNVLCLGPNYRPTGVRERVETVRVQPDDWPPFADPAFAAIDDASTDSGLSRIVVMDDVSRLFDK